MKNLLLSILVSFVCVCSSQAGLLGVYRYVAPGEFAIGVEPELTLTNGAGTGINGKYTHGLSDLTNLSLYFGQGGGPRTLRVGSSLGFDFFPDIAGQPGIGLAVQGMYYTKRVDSGVFEITAIPYIHKTYDPGEKEFEPFFAIPFGWGFQSTSYDSILQVVAGSMFRLGEHFRATVELGLGLKGSETYFSAGVIYFH